MTVQFARYPLLSLILGLVVSLALLSGVGQAVDVDDEELLLAVPVDEPMVLPETTNESLDQADTKSPVEVIQERYQDGTVKIRREVTLNEQGDYILHGEWKMWDKQGNLIASGQYCNNQRVGKWMRVYSRKDAKLFSSAPYKAFRGPFTSEATFEDGQLHGTWTITDGEHRKISEWEYAKGVRDGMSHWYYPTGTVRREITFREGLIEGYVRQYDKNSKLIENSTYQQGRKLAPKVKHTKKGQKSWEGMYLFAQLVIDSPDDWWNAKPVTYTKVGKDVKHGLWTSWHSNGQVRVEGTYEHDLPVGQFTWWFSNAQEAVLGSYQNGQAAGQWVWRHTNGQKSVLGHFHTGEMTGMWTYWKEDGRLHEKSDFSAATAIAMPLPEAWDESGDSPPAKISQIPQADTTVK